MIYWWEWDDLLKEEGGDETARGGVITNVIELSGELMRSPDPCNNYALSIRSRLATSLFIYII